HAVKRSATALVAADMRPRRPLTYAARHAPDHRIADLPQLPQADRRLRGALSVLRRLESQLLWLWPGAPAAGGSAAGFHPAHHDRVRRAVRGVAGTPARGDPPDARPVRDPVTRQPGPLPARHDRWLRLGASLVVDAADRDLPARRDPPHLL